MTDDVVLVLGDVMRDIVVRPAGPLRRGTDRAATIRMVPGGSGANQAAWLASRGVPTRLIACVGHDDLGAETQRLRAAGVDPMLVGHPMLPTGTLIAMIDPSDGERSFLTDRGANDALCLPADAATLLDGVWHLHVSGYAFVGPVTRAAAEALIALARSRGVPISFDPGSAGFLAEEDPAEILRALAGAATCIANSDEAAVLTGLSEKEGQLRRLVETFDLAVLKCGADGALARHRDGRAWTVPGQPVAVVDTIGAGDAFLAGFLASQRAGLDIAACLARAVALGAFAATRLGGAPP